MGAAYSNSFNGPFLFDDQGDIERNTNIRDLKKVWQSVGASDAPGATAHPRPIAMLSFALNYACSGLATHSYHITNLAIHLLAALTLLGIVRAATLSLPSMGSIRPRRYAAGAGNRLGLGAPSVANPGRHLHRAAV